MAACIVVADDLTGANATGVLLTKMQYRAETIIHDEAESDSLSEAMEELGASYDESEVRLVRIKFLCEVAN